MQDEQIFRVILIFGFVTVFPVGLYHRLKAHASKDKLDRRQEGIFILLTLRPIAAAKMLGLLAGVIHPGCMAWSSVGLPPWLRWIGVPLDTVERYDAYPADEGWVVLDERLPGQPRHVGAAATGPDGQI